jgi:hypothetical protein
MQHRLCSCTDQPQLCLLSSLFFIHAAYKLSPVPALCGLTFVLLMRCLTLLPVLSSSYPAQKVEQSPAELKVTDIKSMLKTFAEAYA